MLRPVLRLMVAAACFAGIPAVCPSDFTASCGGVPDKNTPQKVLEAWLAFHATDLCQEVDAVFVFNQNGAEVWCRIEGDRSFQKFQGLFEPLKNAGSLEVYVTRVEAEKKKGDEENPPPSLWQNLELRSNLGEYVPAIAGRMLEDRLRSMGSSAPETFDALIKQRLRIYAEQVLNLNRRMDRYASDLADLTQVAYGAGISADMKSRAAAACAGHARNLEKNIGKLTANLLLAFPMSERKRRSFPRSRLPAGAAKDAVEKATRIAAAEQSVSQHVYHFIYPEDYTVKLQDLRHPSLLESLGRLREMVLDYEKCISLPARK